MGILADKIRSLFSNENLTIIHAKDLEDAPLNEWQYINEDKIRYKMIAFNDEYAVSITEWLDDCTFNLHLHPDADETIFIIIGKLYSVLDKITRTIYGKLFYKAGTAHILKCKKGTLISVKFDFKNI